MTDRRTAWRVAIAIALLAGCAGDGPPAPIEVSSWADDATLVVVDYPAVAAMAEQGPAFGRALRRGYLELAEVESGALTVYGRKAVAAAEGRNVQPSLPPDAMAPLDVAVLGEARERLLDVADAGWRNEAPDEAAAAQVAYDCWLHETARGNPAVADRCRLRFEGAIELAAARQRVVPTEPEEPPILSRP